MCVSVCVCLVRYTVFCLISRFTHVMHWFMVVFVCMKACVAHMMGTETMISCRMMAKCTKAEDCDQILSPSPGGRDVCYVN